MTGKSKTFDTRINCYACKHFYVTWDPQLSRGCRAFGFKSVALPSIVVKQSSGAPCMKFVKKGHKGRNG
ncbi:uracil-DNA glycosylase [Anoxybacillus flavithermus]|uniref:uracil-DNA glycosylase n=1 Tax=Anoxybacillus flavithermus TaxID=33934 RepID=UPI001DD22A6D|nr:uracil-DNA glycosylase [Anoxybacillus flavithermus]MBE2918773.1 uracil-DNA glycosylase [Anoxybacillus flavithermus]MBE2932322.1 uracil-DNA glycosylase [Anoxybacillus flavithermus]